MLGVTDLRTYVVGAALITLLPGPNSMYVLSLAAQRGVRPGYRGTLGVLLGDTALMVLSAAGVAALLRAHSAVLGVGRYAGAGYLAYVGFNMMRGAWRRWLGPATAAAHRVRPSQHRLTKVTDPEWTPHRDDAPAPLHHPHRARPGRHRLNKVADPEWTPHRDAPGPFRSGLLISLLNPKMILFFLSYFTQFVDPHFPHPGMSFALLGGVIQLFSLLYLTTLILAGSFLARQFRQRHHLAAGAMFLAGAVFVGFGITLGTASLV